MGGRYGSGCFHFSRRASVSLIRSCHAVSDAVSRVEQVRVVYPLPARLGDGLVGFEERADVHGLATPQIAVDGPVEGELQRAAVKPPGRCQRCRLGLLCSRGRTGRWFCSSWRRQCACVFRRVCACVGRRNGWACCWRGVAVAVQHRCRALGVTSALYGLCHDRASASRPVRASINSLTACFRRPLPRAPSLSPSPASPSSSASLLMSGQQCLRRLAASSPMRSQPLLCPSSRALRLSASTATRSYSALSRAASSRLLAHASRYPPSLALALFPLTCADEPANHHSALPCSRSRGPMVRTFTQKTRAWLTRS